MVIVVNVVEKQALCCYRKEEMSSGYYYGRPEKEGSYESLLSVFSAHESLNSAQTSSLPLVQFWRDDADLDRRVSEIVQGIPGLDIRAAEKRFEYATSLPPKSGRGKSSMTDLMILSEHWRVAVEAKYTEYMEDPKGWAGDIGLRDIRFIVAKTRVVQPVDVPKTCQNCSCK